MISTDGLTATQKKKREEIMKMTGKVNQPIEWSAVMNTTSMGMVTQKSVMMTHIRGGCLGGTCMCFTGPVGKEVTTSM